MKVSYLGFLLISLLALFSCSGEDRSGERPFPPTVSTKSVSVEGNTCTLIGEVLSSPNSSLKSCGFYFGTDSTKKQITIEKPSALFSTTVDSLKTQTNYFAVAYASNGMGTSYGDTIWFELK
jgi:hypothetical protein